MEQLGFKSGNSGILRSTWGLYGNDLGMTWKYLGGSGRV